jgi:hypothetical protein
MTKVDNLPKVVLLAAFFINLLRKMNVVKEKILGGHLMPCNFSINLNLSHFCQSGNLFKLIYFSAHRKILSSSLFPLGEIKFDPLPFNWQLHLAVKVV